MSTVSSIYQSILAKLKSEVGLNVCMMLLTLSTKSNLRWVCNRLGWLHIGISPSEIADWDLEKFLELEQSNHCEYRSRFASHLIKQPTERRLDEVKYFIFNLPSAMKGSDKEDDLCRYIYRMHESKRILIEKFM